MVEVAPSRHTTVTPASATPAGGSNSPERRISERLERKHGPRLVGQEEPDLLDLPPAALPVEADDVLGHLVHDQAVPRAGAPGHRDSVADPRHHVVSDVGRGAAVAVAVVRRPILVPRAEVGEGSEDETDVQAVVDEERVAVNAEWRDDTATEATVPRIYMEETVVEGIVVERLDAGGEPTVKPDATQVAAVMSAEPSQVPAPVPHASVAVLRQGGLRSELDRNEEKRGCDRNRYAAHGTLLKRA